MKRSYISGRIVPKILHLASADSGIQDEADFLAQLGVLVGEAKELMDRETTDWREFRRVCGVRQNFWQLLRSAARPGKTSSLGRMRDTFYFLIEQFAESPAAASNQRPPLDYLVPHALAQTAGTHCAAYYNWCEANRRVTDGMKRLDLALSQGV